GKDIFSFSIKDYRGSSENFEPRVKNLLVCPGMRWGCYTNPNGCSYGSTSDCTTLIFNNGWEIPDNYPL
ncbi:MAG: hypothetical protein LUG16_05355, partial [Candidatus Gastranaerophilales bacterium]|nr:hypothetical protein [Candidatus Gastranaerophilales bacterium]